MQNDGLGTTIADELTGTNLAQIPDNQGANHKLGQWQVKIQSGQHSFEV